MSQNIIKVIFFDWISAGQRADGLFGAIVVRDPADVNADIYDHDLPEHVIVVS